jgi:hypothetical protein
VVSSGKVSYRLAGLNFCWKNGRNSVLGTWQTFDLKHIVEGKQQIINDEIFLQFCKLF